jgi:ubiquinone/menaquinone biosynthesis C-methylase UbiE
MARYVLGSSQKEIDRLNIQSALFEKETLQTLKLAGIEEGMRCLDAGCGVGHTTLLISDRVGNNGKVIGLDINEANINACKKKFILYQ